MADDIELWARICQGDAIAFDDFYRGNAARLEVFLQYQLGNRQAAEDVMQETFATIWRRPNGFKPERGSLRTYLFGIGRKQAAEWWRKHPATSDFEADPIVAATETSALLGLSLIHILLTISMEGGTPFRCAISLEPQKGICGGGLTVKGRPLNYDFRVTAREGDRVALAVQLKWDKPILLNDPQEQYWFTLGETLRIEQAGVSITVNGEPMDHMPAFVDDEVLDPGPDELRVVSPYLVSGNTGVVDFDGMMISGDRTHVVCFYKGGFGRYLISLSPLRGAVEGRALFSRISFVMDGKPYQWLTGAPIARTERVWILHQPEYKPSIESSEMPDASTYGTTVKLSELGDLVVR